MSSALRAGCPGVRQSMSRKGECRDNARAKSFLATLKRELDGLDGRRSGGGTEDEHKQAPRLLLWGNSGRGVGKALDMSRSNARRCAAEEEKIPVFGQAQAPTLARSSLTSFFGSSGAEKAAKLG